ncbi:hypothetical protein BCR34DRAFT_601272 [Clohesyomyces aquaticus]|uniref:Uncharacterized protein n=1 Tax=Clohesyomyces aquaticus TaxID=1231657 RepID=A0A1Y1ZNU4_9PLEO|nr:hypothetical protein BCR34DRAFT_601272 [Clohesyomyces aquaticus]
MPDQPHSKTVRGTLSNPKTQAAIKNKETPPGIGGPAAQVEPKKSSSTSSSRSVPSGSTGATPQSTGTGEQNREKLPHSKTVRGTLANTDGRKVDKMMLGIRLV